MPEEKKGVEFDPTRKTNPFGVNQYTLLDPRQKHCWDYYINPRSETFGNAKQSAIKAGYDVDYADQITTIDWFLGRLRRLNMLGKAEKVLDETLEMPVLTLEWEGHGEEREQVVVTNPALVKIKQDTAKFIAERLGKLEGYSARTEVTAADGEPLALTMVINVPKPEDDIQSNEEAVPSVAIDLEPAKD